MYTDTRIIVPTSGTPDPTSPPPDPPVQAGSILWDEPAFLGYSQTTGTTSIGGSIYTNVTSGQAPLVVHASASAITDTGGTETLTGNLLNPYLHHEHRWTTSLVSNGSLATDGEIIDPNTLNPVDYFQEQIGGEAVFIFHEPGTYRITLATTAANGIFNTFTQDITVDEPTYDHLFFDPAGNNSNNGRTAFLVSFTGGSYDHPSRTLTAAGAFVNYDHTTATSETYLTDNSNWIWIDGFGGFRIASKPAGNDTLILAGDGLGSNQTGLQTNSGPKQTFNPSTNLAANTAHHFKGGNTFTVTSGISTVNKDGVRLMAYGSSQATIRASGGIGTPFGAEPGSGDATGDHSDLHRIIYDGGNDLGATVGRMLFLPANAETGTKQILFDRCKFFNFSNSRLIQISSGVVASPALYNFLSWGTDWDNRKTTTESKSSAILGSIKDGGHSALVGSRHWGVTDVDDLLEHHVYLSGPHGHRLRSFNDYVQNDQFLNYCLNENCGNDPGDPITRYMTIYANRFRSCYWGIDAANASNNFTLGTFSDIVVIRNTFDGSDGLLLGGIFTGSTRDCFVGHNLAISLSRGLWDFFRDISTGHYYFDNNVVYESWILRVASAAGNYQVVNNIAEGSATNEQLLGWSSIGNGPDTYIQNNQFWAPNDTTPYNDGGTFETLAQLNSDLNNLGNIEEDPQFTDPQNKDFTRSAVKFETVRFTIPNQSAGTTFNIDLAAGFGVPKGFIMIQTAMRTDIGGWTPDTNTYNRGSWGFGASDGTNHRAVKAVMDTEATPGQVCENNHVNAYSSIRRHTAGWLATSVQSFETDRVVMSLDDNANAGELVQCIGIVIGGDAVDSVVVGGHDDIGAGAGTTPINTGQNQADLVFTFTTHTGTLNASPTSGGSNVSADARLSVGVAINDGSNSQMGMTYHAPTGPTNPTAAAAVGIYNDSAIAELVHGTGEAYSAAVSFTSTGFNVATDATSGSTILSYASIKFNRAINMAMIDTTITNGWGGSVSGAGFTPGWGFWLNMAGPSAYNTHTEASFSQGITTFDGSNTYTMSHCGPNGVTLSDSGTGTSSWISARSELSLMVSGGGNNQYQAISSGDAFTSDGVDFTMTTTPSTSVLGRMLLIGAN